MAHTRRGVPLIFVSGYSKEALPNAFAHTPVLSKPYTSDSLVAAMQNLRRRPQGVPELRRKTPGQHSHAAWVKDYLRTRSVRSVYQNADYALRNGSYFRFGFLGSGCGSTGITYICLPSGATAYEPNFDT